MFDAVTGRLCSAFIQNIASYQGCWGRKGMASAPLPQNFEKIKIEKGWKFLSINNKNKNYLRNIFF
jgi:hypothetical protein